MDTVLDLGDFPREELVRAYLFNSEILLARGPKAIEETMGLKHYDFAFPKFVPYFFQLCGVRGLFAEAGETHRTHRKALSKWFSPHNLRQQWPQLLVGAKQMIKNVKSQLETRSSPGSITTAREWAIRATLDVTLMMFVNPVSESFQGESTIYSSLLGSMGAFMSIFIFAVFIASDARLLKVIPRAFIRDIADNRDRAKAFMQRAYEDETGRLADHKSRKTGKSILQTAMEGSFTAEEAVNHGITMIGAGFKTMASALQWAVFRLGRHPDVQVRLRTEISEHLPSFPNGNDQEAMMQSLLALPYLDSFCNEVLRCNPPQVVTIREAIHDTTITGTFIPKGTKIPIMPQTVHTDTQIWGESAHEFDPERWLQKDKHQKGKLNFIPFGYGPRQCIAQHFARHELLCLVAAFVTHFETCLEDPNAPIVADNDIVSSPLDGVRVRLTAI